ncbi:unnamed protein product [Parajaminaea phylloscopi]
MAEVTHAGPSSSKGSESKLTQAELIDCLQQLTQQILANSPVYSHMLSDIHLVSCEPGRVEYSLPLQPIHLNSHQTMHGATSATLVDFMGGPVIASLSQEPLKAPRGVSTDISIQYLNAARAGETLRIIGRSKKRGRHLAWVGVEIRSLQEGHPDGKIIAEGSHTKFLG